MQSLSKTSTLELKDLRSEANAEMWTMLIVGSLIAIGGAVITNGKFDLTTFISTILMAVGVYYIALALVREKVLDEIDAERRKRYYEYIEGQTKGKK